MRYDPNRPLKERARGQVRDAILRNEIIVPDACEKCGTKNRKCSDGRRYLHAHHHDHNRPLEIEWLCAKCHRKVTPLPTGEANGASKLTIESVACARRLHAEGHTYTHIAYILGVDRRTVSRAVNAVHWLAARSNKETGK